MPNSAEIIERLAIQTTCHKILLTIKENCKDIKDVEEYILVLLRDAEER